MLCAVKFAYKIVDEYRQFMKEKGGEPDIQYLQMKSKEGHEMTLVSMRFETDEQMQEFVNRVMGMGLLQSIKSSERQVAGSQDEVQRAITASPPVHAIGAPPSRPAIEAPPRGPASSDEEDAPPSRTSPRL